MFYENDVAKSEDIKNLNVNRVVEILVLLT